MKGVVKTFMHAYEKETFVKRKEKKKLKSMLAIKG